MNTDTSTNKLARELQTPMTEPTRIPGDMVDWELSVESAIEQVGELFPSADKAALRTLAALFTHHSIFRYAAPPAQEVPEDVRRQWPLIRKLLQGERDRLAYSAQIYDSIGVSGRVAAIQTELLEINAAIAAMAQLSGNSGELAQQPTAPAAAGVPSIAAAEAMGANGGAACEPERLAFEAWMKGHCWALSATWRGTQYRSDAEEGGDVDPRAIATRRIWAAWRDRAALAPPQQLGVPAQQQCAGDAVAQAINSKDLYQVLMDVQNGIDSPALQGMANDAIRRIDKARAALAAPPAQEVGR